jgi:predicted amidohydrolase
VPAAFTETTGRAHWEMLLRARAIENQCYVMAPARAAHEKRARNLGQQHDHRSLGRDPRPAATRDRAWWSATSTRAHRRDARQPARAAHRVPVAMPRYGARAGAVFAAGRATFFEIAGPTAKKENP